MKKIFEGSGYILANDHKHLASVKPVFLKSTDAKSPPHFYKYFPIIFYAAIFFHKEPISGKYYYGYIIYTWSSILCHTSVNTARSVWLVQEQPPPEWLMLLALIVVVCGGTLVVNFIVNLFLPGLH